ncbi:MAG: tetratricopeptide repeat protein [Gemmatimonadota bacterium]|nr:tetratricopeptide repeat protein [Gemmatimonadota bacterium]
MKKLINEVHRRSLWQVLGIYLGASWIALQVVNEIGDAVGLPEWVSPGALVLLVLGAPVVLGTAFINQGLKTREPEAEPQSLADAGEVPPPRPPEKTGAEKLFTWKRAMLGGAAAFALLLVGAGIWMAMRVTGVGPAGTLVAKGLLEEHDRIVLADFGGGTSDEALANTVTEAVRVDLARSQVVRLADPEMVSGALRRMGRADAERLDEDLARELAQREGLKAVLTGDVAPAGSGYVLTASLIAPATGEILTSERATARSEEDVIDAIDELSKAVRERIGESLRTIRAEEGLAQVTTSDLEALRLYTEGAQLVEGDDYQRGLDMLEEAIARDSAFAMAHRKLGVELSNRFENRSRELAAIEAAYRHRDRLSPRERYLAEAAYHGRQGDTQRQIDAYQNMLDIDPEDPWALNNLGGIYGNLGDYATAEPYMERAVQADSLSSALSINNVILVEVGQGKYEEAEETLATAQRRFPDEGRIRVSWALLPSAKLQYDSAVSRTATLLEDASTPFQRSQAADIYSATVAARGELEESERILANAEQVDVDRGLTAEAFEKSLAMVWSDIQVLEDLESAQRRFEAALAKYPLDEMNPVDLPWVQLARLSALAGDIDRSSELSAQYLEEIPEESRGLGPLFMQLAEADRSLRGGDPDTAIDLYRRVEDRCRRCGLYWIAQAHLAAERPDSAIATYTRLVDDNNLYRVYDDAGELGPSYERLAQLHDQRGELELAARYYAALVELWADADEILQPRVQAADDRLQEILREIG